ADQQLELLALAPAVLEVPRERLLAAERVDALAAVAEHQLLDRAGVSLQIAEADARVAAAHVPDLDVAAAVAGGQQAAVLAELDRRDRVAVALELLDQLGAGALADVPQIDDALGRPDGQPATFGSEGRDLAGAGARGQGARLTDAGAVPQDHGAGVVD